MSRLENQEPPATPPSARAKLRKIPPIPVRRNASEAADDSDDEKPRDDDPNPSMPTLLPSSLRLNQIRTRSPLPSNLRFSSTSVGDEGRTEKGYKAVDARPKRAVLPHLRTTSEGEGECLVVFGGEIRLCGWRYLLRCLSIGILMPFYWTVLFGHVLINLEEVCVCFSFA